MGPPPGKKAIIIRSAKHIKVYFFSGYGCLAADLFRNPAAFLIVQVKINLIAP